LLSFSVFDSQIHYADADAAIFSSSFRRLFRFSFFHGYFSSLHYFRLAEIIGHCRAQPLFSLSFFFSFDAAFSFHYAAATITLMLLIISRFF
jgi:hypothetical protein